MKNPVRGLIALCLTIAATIAQAQTGVLSGSVQDAAHKPADAATIVLVRASDSSTVKMTLADEQGRFRLEDLPTGIYSLWITMIGYQDYKSDTINLNGGSREWPSISLEQKGAALQEVEIQGRKAFIERKIDRTVVNVDALIGNAGTTALDVLEKSPGVQVDQNGGISLKGKQGVVVFIDDKPTYMSGTDLQNYLRSMPSSTLDQIELMSNPPARYDAAGGAVINIRTKKTKAKGFNGNLSLSYAQGKYGRTANSLSLNYRDGRFNIFTSLSQSVMNGFNDLDINRRYKNEDGSTRSYFMQNTYLRMKSQSYSAKAGADFYQDDKTTWGIQLNGQLRPSSVTNNNRNDLLNAAGQTDSVITAASMEKGRFRNGGINANYRKQFNKDGHELTADLDYILFKTNNDQAFDNFSYMPDGMLAAQDRLTGSLPARIDIYSAKTDYTRPLPGGYIFSGGLKASYTKTDNLAVYEHTAGGITLPDYGKSNNFRYKESIGAAYVNLNKDFKRLSVQLGLRLEHTRSDGHQLGNVMKPDSAFSRNYTNLFPTVFLNYKLDSAAHHQLNLNYGRRINRPYYQDLNPFISPLDKFTYYVGNPFLRPSIIDNIELSYTYHNKITLAYAYNRVRNDVAETIEITDGIYYSRPGNIGRNESHNLSLNATLELLPWLDFNGYTEVCYIHSSGDFYTGKLDNKGTYWFIQPNMQLKLGKGWIAELSGNYITDVTNVQFVMGANGALNAGLQKSIGKNITLKGNVSDIFYTTVGKGVIRNLTLTDANWYNKFDTRRISISFSYRFGKTTANERKHSGTGAESEKNRVKS